MSLSCFLLKAQDRMSCLNLAVVFVPSNSLSLWILDFGFQRECKEVTGWAKFANICHGILCAFSHVAWAANKA